MGFREFSRTDRVAQQIRRELAGVLARDSKDPRFGLLTISRVDVSRDLAYAKVFVATPPDADVGAAMKALRKASGFLRSALARRIRIRAMPQLQFVHDEGLESAMRVSALLGRAAEEDAGSRE